MTKKIRRAPAAPPPASPGTILRWLDWILLGGILAGFVVFTRQFDFIQDDAYITFRYIRNLLAGNGLVFNPGEHVEGYTTFLWTLLLAVPVRLGLDVVALSRTLGVLCSLVTLGMLLPLSRQTSPGKLPFGIRLIAPALLAACGAFAYWTVSGMETALFSMLAVLSAWCYLRERNRTRGVGFTPWMFAVLALTRPEGMLLFGLTVLHRAAEIALHTKEERAAHLRHLALLVGVFALPVAAFTAWRLVYYGYFFPNTYYAKAGFSPEYLAAGWDYLLHYARNYLTFTPLTALPGILLAVPAAVLLLWKRTGPVLYLLLLVVVYTAYIVSVGGDVLHAHRFFLAIAPFILLLVQEAVCVAIERFRLRGPVPVLAILAATALLAGDMIKRPAPYLANVGMKEAGLVERMSTIGRWIQRASPPDAVMAASTIGALSYFAGIPLIDMLGLTDATIAHHPEYIGGVQSVWRERKYNVSYVLSRTPLWICFSTGVKPSAFAERALFTRAEFRRWYYPYYFHPTGDARSIDVMYRRATETIPVDTDTSRIDNDFINQFYDGVNRVGQRPSEALEYLRRAEALAPRDFGLLHEMTAEAQMRLGDLAGAERTYGRAVEADPRLAESQMMLARFAMERKDPAAARDRLAQAVRFHPDFALAWVEYGQAALALGDSGAARDALARSLRITPNNGQAAELLRRLQ
jgi:tetratricopeptide (TPR) repeat protein